MKYEIMILLREESNDRELKVWAFDYAKTLRKLGASEISVISRGKRELAYRIEDQKRGCFIQINFSSPPQTISDFYMRLKRDTNVLRYLIFNREVSN